MALLDSSPSRSFKIVRSRVSFSFSFWRQRKISFPPFHHNFSMMKRKEPSNNPTHGRRRKLRLLIHAVDGCVPYLTPSTLEKYFPPELDDFWIGLSVRDTCVVPLFGDKTKTKKVTKKASNTQNKKPRGYTFASVNPDSWLMPYTRITVPSFDLINDDKRGIHSSTNNSVSVWTPHGRQKLTKELYSEATKGLKSHYTLSLYDIVAGDQENKKRKLKAEARNKEWFEDLFQTFSRDQRESTLWSPILLPSEKDSLPDVKMANERANGLALVGKWRKEFETCFDHVTGKNVAILSTRTLPEMLEIISGGTVNIVGTDLPTRWAKQKCGLAININVKGESKRAKLDENDNIIMLNSDGCIDFHSKDLARDSRPIMEGCSCMTCADNKFSRSYIHHLVVAQELVAEILLFAHNLHQLLTLFRSFSSSDDTERLKEFILTQLPSNTKKNNT